VVSQRLLPRRDGNGRVVAAEVMLVTPTIRELILDPARSGEIRDFIADGREQYGMQTFDQHLMDLVMEGLVEFDVAIAAATRPSDFQLQMRTLADGALPVVGASASAPASDAATELAESSGAGINSGFDFFGS
jgi:twitching motility protein PilT